MPSSALRQLSLRTAEWFLKIGLYFNAFPLRTRQLHSGGKPCSCVFVFAPRSLQVTPAGTSSAWITTSMGPLQP